MSSAPVTRVGGAGFGYSRYVPGADPASITSQSQGVQYFQDENTSSLPSRRKRAAEEGDETNTSGRKQKKSKSKSKSTLDADDESDQEDVERKKSKKKKKSKKEKETNGAGPSEDTEMSDAGEDEAEEDRLASKKAKRKDREEKKDAKRRDKKKRKEEAASPSPEEEDTRMADVDETTAQADEDEVKEPTDKKRRKKDKAKAKAADSDEEETTGKKGDRHKTIMEKAAKSLKLAEKTAAEEVPSKEEEPEEVHPLEPLPQPQLVTTEAAKPTYETLPNWLAAPIRVSSDTRTPFSDLGILPKAARVLKEEGFPDAFAVQTAAIPLLLPSSKQQTGDLLISAATGSGKTLAYALPIVRDISQGVVTRFRALVVLPTRDLIEQAYKVFELCAKTYDGGDRKRVRIGVSMGGQTLKSEQDGLIETHTRYDPAEYDRIRKATLSDPDAWLGANSAASKSRLGKWTGDVVDYTSKVDVLICTPGRLVEHIEQTPGFDLDYVRWLVVDEADKLLAQSYQGWLDVAMAKLKTSKFTSREFLNTGYSGVRKVVLSATLTSDLSLLNQLALRRPKLIQLEGEGREVATATAAEHSLPALLSEFAIRVKDTNMKPLYLLDLLRGEHMGGGSTVAPITKATEKDVAESDSTSDTSSDTSSDSSSDTSSEGSSDSDSDSDSDTSSSGSDTSSEAVPVTKSVSLSTTLPRLLIFTKSNESALRLSRLLSLLDPSLAPHITTLASTTPTHIRRKTLRAFATDASPLRLIIASDLVGRGIDLPNLDHVINYDLPPSAEAYVHRVGRTARAGRSGKAWTLVGDAESGWFWGIIGKGKGIKRAQKVGRVMIEEMGDDKVKMYEAALEKLGQEAQDTRRR